MSRLINPWVQHDGPTLPYAGGTVYFGLPNQDPIGNPKAPFSDSALLVPIGEAQTLDSKGMYQTAIFLKGSYSMSLFDSDNNFIRTDPDVRGAITSGDGSVISFSTLIEAVQSIGIGEGDALDIAERTDGNGGGAMWDVVLTSDVTPNSANIVISTGNALLSLVLRPGDVFIPRQWGAVGSGTILDEPIWQAMVSLINTRGGGKILGDPGDIYLLADASTANNSTVFTIDDIKSFEVDLNGATIKTTNVLSQGTINLFKSQDGKNISFHGGVIDTPLLNDAGDPRGIQFFLGHDKCENISAYNLSGPGGVGGLLAFERSDTGAFLAFEDQARGIDIYNIEFDAVGYIGNFRHNGSWAKGRNIKLGFAHRVWFPYGVEEHDVEFELDDFDATGIRIWALEGRTIRNIRVSAKTAGVYPTLRTAASLVQIAFDPTTASFAENITIELQGEGNLKLGHGLEIDIEGAVTGKHTLNNLSISGKSNNMASTGVRYVLNGGSTLADDLIVENLSIEGLRMKDNAGESLLPLSNSTTNHNIDRLVISGSNSRFSLQGDGTAYSKLVTFRDCDASRLYAFSDIRTHFERCVISDSTNQNYPESTYENVTLDSTVILNKPDLRYIVPTKLTGPAQDNVIGYKILSGPTVASIALTLTKGVDIYPQFLPTAADSFVAANVYKFCIGCVSGTDSGQYFGEVLLESNGSTDITAAALSGITLIQTAGSGMNVSHLTVSLSSGSPVFTINSGGPTIYNVAEMVIREI